MKSKIEDIEINNIYIDIKELIEQSRKRIYKTVNTEMINLYWNIGKMIVEKQGGEERARYGDYLIQNLSVQLINKFDKGFLTRNLKRMRNYICFIQKGQQCCPN